MWHCNVRDLSRVTPGDLAESTSLGVIFSVVNWAVQAAAEDEQLFGEMRRNSVLSALSLRWFSVTQNCVF